MNIKDSVQKITDSIHQAELRCGRTPNSVKLMAVSKFHPVERICDASEAGITLFGENRVQEAVEKFPAVLEKNPSAQLHMIGSLQRNKVKQILPLVTCIQSVDRLELLDEIEKQAEKIGKKIEVLFEYHTAEDSKSGFATLDCLVQAVAYAEACPHIIPRGFMTMAPLTDDQKMIRKSFKSLVSAAEKTACQFKHLSLTELSMGMSSDYLIAIEEGSTLVRLGTAIFGARE